MTKAYLEKIRAQLVEEKNALEKQRFYLENAMEENKKFVELLDESNDPNFESFTPRAVNGRNKEKIEELNQQQKHLIGEKSQIEEKMLSVTTQLEECNQVLQHEYELNRIMQHEEATVDKLTDILQKLQLSLEFVDVDTQRCRLEISDVIKSVENMIEEKNK